MKIICCLTVLISFCGCATIEVYQVGRQTVMEEEAQGKWPQFDKKFAPKVINKQAQFFPKVSDSKRKKRVFSVLNGSMVSQ